MSCLLLLASILPCGMSAAEPDVVIAPPLAVPRMSGRDQRDPEPRPAPIGWVDTIGGTVFDWQMSGPARPMLVSSPASGIHALWVYSNNANGYPDRNMRYNFYDYNLRQWMFNDPDYMYSGVGVFAAKSGCGNLAADPVSGVAVVSSHQGQYHPVVARDVSPGAGFFEYCDGRPALDGLVWPAVAVPFSRTTHLALIGHGGEDRLLYSRGSTWCTWDSAGSPAPPQPEPGFPSHNIAAASYSARICLTWARQDPTTSVTSAYLRQSTDDGVVWSPPSEIVIPDIFGADTVSSFHVASVYPWFDVNDVLHIVASVVPVIASVAYTSPAVVVHWSETFGWHVVQRVYPETLLAGVGPNAVFAGRPTICQRGTDPALLMVAWEQFDGTNVEPTTGLLRADIYLSYSADGGRWWTEALRLTDASTASCRFPCLLGQYFAHSSPYVDTVALLYEIDQQAGFSVLGQGYPTSNPIVVQKFTWMGIAEEQPGAPRLEGLNALPNPASGRTRIICALPRPGTISLGLFDASGRCVRTLVSGRVEAGSHTVEWDVRSVPRGVYFLKLATPDKTLTSKLTVAR